MCRVTYRLSRPHWRISRKCPTPSFARMNSRSFCVLNTIPLCRIGSAHFDVRGRGTRELSEGDQTWRPRMVTYPRFANHDYRLSFFTLEQSSHPAAIPLDGVQPSAGCLQVSSKRPDVRLVRSVVVVILVPGIHNDCRSRVLEGRCQTLSGHPLRGEGNQPSRTCLQRKGFACVESTNDLHPSGPAATQ